MRIEADRSELMGRSERYQRARAKARDRCEKREGTQEDSGVGQAVRLSLDR